MEWNKIMLAILRLIKTKMKSVWLKKKFSTWSYYNKFEGSKNLFFRAYTGLQRNTFERKKTSYM